MILYHVSKLTWPLRGDAHDFLRRLSAAQTEISADIISNDIIPCKFCIIKTILLSKHIYVFIILNIELTKQNGDGNMKQRVRIGHGYTNEGKE
ncbi:hypothetical protein DWZ56_12155 [Lachnotalea sp. AF33-28]|jgi:hypothetical protein|nr:hypothetical protein DWZ56_12155 [Lachnotalea sp. AF33-28]